MSRQPSLSRARPTLRPRADGLLAASGYPGIEVWDRGRRVYRARKVDVAGESVAQHMGRGWRCWPRPPPKPELGRLREGCFSKRAVGFACSSDSAWRAKGTPLTSGAFLWAGAGPHASGRAREDFRYSLWLGREGQGIGRVDQSGADANSVFSPHIARWRGGLSDAECGSGSRSVGTGACRRLPAGRQIAHSGAPERIVERGIAYSLAPLHHDHRWLAVTSVAGRARLATRRAIPEKSRVCLPLVTMELRGLSG
jgi:hypothetical protein